MTGVAGTLSNTGGSCYRWGLGTVVLQTGSDARAPEQALRRQAAWRSGLSAAQRFSKASALSSGTRWDASVAFALALGADGLDALALLWATRAARRLMSFSVATVDGTGALVTATGGLARGLGCWILAVAGVLSCGLTATLLGWSAFSRVAGGGLTSLSGVVMSLPLLVGAGACACAAGAGVGTVWDSGSLMVCAVSAGVCAVPTNTTGGASPGSAVALTGGKASGVAAIRAAAGLACSLATRASCRLSDTYWPTKKLPTHSTLTAATVFKPVPEALALAMLSAERGIFLDGLFLVSAPISELDRMRESSQSYGAAAGLARVGLDDNGRFASAEAVWFVSLFMRVRLFLCPNGNTELLPLTPQHSVHRDNAFSLWYVTGLVCTCIALAKSDLPFFSRMFEILQGIVSGSTLFCYCSASL